MAAALLPVPLWDLVEPFLPIPHDGHRVGDPPDQHPRFPASLKPTTIGGTG